uniref:Uncharacterized protein n=1 Tax=Rhizophora mucronata TaxID=61149 RepID=A0A2P2PNY4_RHIMU
MLTEVRLLGIHQERQKGQITLKLLSLVAFKRDHVFKEMSIHISDGSH